MARTVDRRTALKVAGGSLAGVSTGFSGCLSVIGGGSGGKTFVVSSKNFTEQFVLSNISMELLKSAGHEVEDKTGLGGSPANFKALKNDESDLYWEYTGTAWANVLNREKFVTDPESLYNKVDSAYNKQHDIDWLKYAPFNNTYVLVGNPEWTKQNGIDTLEDLAKYVNEGNTDFKVAMNQEMKQRDDAWGGLPKAYGFNSKKQDIGVVQMKISLVYEAVSQGKAELGFGFATNPKIDKHDLPVVEDTKPFFNIYNPAPNIPTEALTEDVKATLNKPTKDLTTETQRKLNAKVTIEGKSAQTVAKNFLKENGYI
ncbi:osmoprotectant transport system substrate-binding protein [Halogranum rubrum]|uniref:Osmoprotectant transport system substrate-binding protein n=1 Tax=Halogranum rubrum TaxID=553466 RepID=A0A1I4HWM5_9EURY|nr:glycine betaine ABC transporter substrate-binding protein [Halogranum rubrum]SFL46041.1 osmoprotectant transport system substrate-binding protein [Halogranum rubrum]